MEPLKKVTYTDKQTPITAKNLNEIQDTIIEMQNTIDELQDKFENFFVVE